MNSVGERIRQARVALGMTQQELGQGLATKGFISQVERNRATPSLPKLRLIADRLGLRLVELMGEERSLDLAYLRKSAEVALRAEEPERALAALEEAAGLQTTANERADLYRLRGTALSELGRQTEALAVLQAAAAAAPPDDAELSAAIYAEIGTVLQIEEKFNAATEANLRAQEWLDRSKHADPELRARVLTNLGTTTYQLGQTSQAEDYYKKALSAATDAESLFRIANAHMALGVTARAAGNLDSAIEHCNRALEIHGRIRQERIANRIIHNLGEVYFQAGDLAKAREHQTRCLARAHQLKDGYAISLAAGELARYSLVDRDPESAEKFAREAQTAARQAHDHIRLAISLALAGAAVEKQKSAALADQLFRRAFRLLLERNAGGKLAEVCVLYSDLLRERGDVDRAFAFMRMASERDFKKLPGLIRSKPKV